MIEKKENVGGGRGRKKVKIVRSWHRSIRIRGKEGVGRRGEEKGEVTMDHGPRI